MFTLSILILLWNTEMGERSRYILAFPKGNREHYPVPVFHAPAFTVSAWLGAYKFLPWHFLNFKPLPQGHGSLRPTLANGSSLSFM